MKKFLAVLLAALMICVSFVACSSEKKSDDTNTDKDTKETLTMVTNAEFPPYEYKEGDNVVGIDADVAQAIADKLGMKLEIVDTKFDAIIPGVQSGKYDMGMAGMTVTPDREKSVAFSDSYATGIQSIIVKQGSDIKSVDDLSEKTKIGVQLGTTGDIYAKDDFGDEAVQEFDKGADAVQALLAGKIDCVIIDNEPAKSFVAANEGLEILSTSYAEEEYAICFKKDNTELQTKVNGALKELIADGTLQKIVNKYIKAE
ncbi:basic amino acid ABC transporter substrate-binding protein [uncultured Eubacterium sp.]|uniref:basic amino acid ABC transporter substrate-binding protein n=1 Tax=uncultured Eubacterium sp. TaxID=165185 RepID=UPI0025DECCBE|nr:basic amino acid ABC transporter substrate-binding protein [uncultured Eubacterium sp.]